MRVIDVSIDSLKPKVLVRRDVGNLIELVESIKERGVLQPLIVSESDDGRYEIIWGYRRYLAALEAGLKELPAISLGRVSIEEALKLILEEDLLRFPLRRDERCLILAALATRWGVRKTAKALNLPPSTVESAKKAGLILKGVRRIMRTSHSREDVEKLRIKLKLAEEIYEALSKAGYKGEEFDKLAGELYLMLMNLPTKTASSLLDNWVENPRLDYMRELVQNAMAGRPKGERSRILVEGIEERVPIDIGDGRPLEELLASYSWSTNQPYQVVEERMLKIIEFGGEYSGVSGLLCPRCSQPIRCRVCGALVNCLCGYPHSDVRDRRYKYAIGKNVVG